MANLPFVTRLTDVGHDAPSQLHREERRKETELDLVSVGTDREIIKTANPGHNKYFLHYCFCSLKHRGITTKIDILNCMHHELIHVTVPTAVSACADVPVLKSWLEDRMTARHGAQHYTVLRQVTLPV